MHRRPYRVEINNPKNRKSQYYLVKDVKFKDKKKKIRIYLGTIPPTPEDVDKYCKEYAYEIELKAASKKAELSSVFYSSDYLSIEEMNGIENIRFIAKTFMSLLTTNEMETYEINFDIHYIQGTTSIEGNTLSLEEASDLLMRGIAPKDKTLREINEVQNFRNVKEYRDKYRGKVTLDFIKTLHSLIMNNIDFESAGAFRRTDFIAIRGCEHQVTPSILIEDELQQIIDKYYSRLDEGRYPFEESVLFHYEFEMIHPFTDGNGRVGREIFNYMLTKAEYPKLLFLGKDRDIYIDSLQLANKNRYGEMVRIFANLVASQRYEIMKANLEKVVNPPQKTGQSRLSDFEL